MQLNVSGVPKKQSDTKLNTVGVKPKSATLNVSGIKRKDDGVIRNVDVSSLLPVDTSGLENLTPEQRALTVGASGVPGNQVVAAVADEAARDTTFKDTTTGKERTWGDEAVTGALRIGGSIVGTVVGAAGGVLLGAPTGPGALASGGAGAVIGGGVGAGVGDAAAQWYEQQRGLRDGYSAAQGVVETVAGAVPMGKLVPGKMQIVKTALKAGGLTTAAAGTQIGLEQKRLPTWREAGTAFGMGAGLGAVMHPIAVRLAAKGKGPGPAGVGTSIGQPPNAVQASDVITAQVPSEFAWAQPKYSVDGRDFTVQFPTDIERVAFVAAQQPASSKANPMMEWVVKATGMTEQQVRAFASETRAMLLKLSRQVPDDATTISLSTRLAKATAGQLPDNLRGPDVTVQAGVGVPGARGVDPSQLPQPVGPERAQGGMAPQSAVEMEAAARAAQQQRASEIFLGVESVTADPSAGIGRGTAAVQGRDRRSIEETTARAIEIKAKNPTMTSQQALAEARAELSVKPTVAGQAAAARTPGAPSVSSPVNLNPTLPRELSGAKPRYSYGPRQFEIEFASDLDKAAFITAQANPSKRDADFVKFVADNTGLSDAEVREFGRAIRLELKELAESSEPGATVLKLPPALAVKTPDGLRVPTRPEGPLVTGKPASPDAHAVEMRARARERAAENARRTAQAKDARVAALGERPKILSLYDAPSPAIDGQEAYDRWRADFEAANIARREWDERARMMPEVEVRLLGPDDDLPAPLPELVAPDAPISKSFEDLTWQERDEMRRLLTEVGPGTPTFKAVMEGRSASYRTVQTAIERYVEGKNTGKLSPIVERAVRVARRRLSGEQPRMFSPGGEGFEVYAGGIPEDVRLAEQSGVDPSAVRVAGEVDPADIARATTEQPPATVQSMQPDPEGRVEIPPNPMTDEQKFEGLKFTAFPEPIREDVKAVLKENQGFEAQRRGVQTWEGHTRPASEAINVDLQNVLARGTALNAEELMALQDTLMTLSVRTRRLAEQLVQNPANLRVAAELAEVRAQHRVVEASLAGATTEAGRALNIVRATAKIRNKSDAAFFEELQKLPQFADDQRAFAETMVQIGDDPLAQYKFLQGEARKNQTWDEWWRSYMFANMLSGIPTHERNLQSNVLNVTFGIAADAARDAVRGNLGPTKAYLRGVRQALLAKPDETSKALALGPSINKAFFALRHGFVLDNFSSKLDDVSAEFRGGGANPFNWPRRALEASDVFFKEIVRGGEQYRAAFELAKKNGGMEGLEERMARYLDGTTPFPEDVQKQIDQVVLKAVFQEAVGGSVQLLITAMRNGDKWLAEKRLPFRWMFITPFMRIAANLTRQGLAHTPLGLLTKEGQAAGRVGEHARARMAMGTMALAPIGVYAAQGYITGAGPQDPKERAEWLDEGKRPHSFYVPWRDEWVNYQTWQPIALPMAMIANAVESGQYAWERAVEQYGEDSDEARMSELAIAEMFWRTVWNTVLRTGDSLLSQSMLSGIETWLKGMDRPDPYSDKVMAGIVAQNMPLSAMGRSMGQFIEQQQQGDASVRIPRSVREMIKQNIPVLSQDVSPLVDRAGQEAKVYGSPLMRGFWAVSPVDTSVVNAEIKRLGVQPIRPSRELTDDGKPVALSLTEQTELMKARGQARFKGYEAAMALPDYNQLSFDQQKDLLEKFATENVTFITELAKVTKRLKEPLSHAKLLAGLQGSATDGQTGR